jgi:hypothetical protein
LDTSGIKFFELAGFVPRSKRSIGKRTGDDLRSRLRQRFVFCTLCGAKLANGLYAPRVVGNAEKLRQLQVRHLEDPPINQRT